MNFDGLRRENVLLSNANAVFGAAAAVDAGLDSRNAADTLPLIFNGDRNFT